MISRQSALLIYCFYEDLFTEQVSFAEPYLKTDALWDLLYANDFDERFLDLIKQATNPTKLKQLISELHTGRIIPKSMAVGIYDCQTAGREILKNLAVVALTITANIGHEVQTIGDIGQEIKAQLELDGYIYKDKKLYASESSVIDEPAEQTFLENLVDGLSLADANTIKHHLKRSEEHFIGGKWDDSISNSRKVLDAILTQVASAIYSAVNNKPIPPAMLKNATDIRSFLERQNIVTKVEREALEKTYGALSVNIADIVSTFGIEIHRTTPFENSDRKLAQRLSCVSSSCQFSSRSEEGSQRRSELFYSSRSSSERSADR